MKVRDSYFLIVEEFPLTDKRRKVEEFPLIEMMSRGEDTYSGRR
jgi:hypothetical protein